MVDGFDVDPEAIRDQGLTLRDSLEPLLRAAGDVPEADAGLMTLVIERAITTLLEAIGGYSATTARMGDDMVRSALHYHWADQESRASFARLLLAGSSEQEAERLASGSQDPLWDQVEHEQLQDLRDLFSPSGTGAGASTTDTHGSGIESLLLGPLGDPGPDATGGETDSDAP